MTPARAPLFQHQIDALQLAEQRGSLALFHSPGLGKTRTCLEAFTIFRRITPQLKLLVVCPLSLIEAAWGTDIEKFTNYRWTGFKRFDPAADIWIINYESLIRPTAQRLLQQQSSPLMLVVDESSRLRDPRSRTTKTILLLAKQCLHRLICSGTPAPNGLYELWAQIRVVYPTLVHESFYAFRREYFHLARAGRTMAEPPPSRQAMQSLFQQGWQWSLTAQSRDRLLTRIRPATHWVRKEDALPDLPERISTIRHVTLSAEELTAYESMRRQVVVEFQSEVITAEMALTKLMKLRQLTSGFCYGQTTHQIGTSRLRALEEALDELGPQPVIIWAHFHEEIEQIAAALGPKAVTLYAKTDDRNDSLRRFGTDAQYLIAHPKSAAHGLTLTQSSTAVWYSLDWSLEMYQQANDRIHRIGQTRSCLYVHLIAPGRIDEEIWSVLQRKTTLQHAMDRILGGRVATLSGAGDSPSVADRVDLCALGSVEKRDS